MPRSNPPSARRLRLAVLELERAESGLNRARAWVKVNNAIADGVACPRCGGRMSWDAAEGLLACGADGTTVAITTRAKRPGRRRT